MRPDVERLLGGTGDDTLTGNSGTNVLSAGPATTCSTPAAARAIS